MSALAPAVAALTGFGVVALTRWARGSWLGVAVAAAAVGLTAWVAVTMLGRTPDFAPSLRVAIPVAAALAVAGLVALRAGLRTRPLLALAGVTAALALAGGPASYSVATVGQSPDLQQRARRTGERRRRVRRRPGWPRRIVVRFRWAGRRQCRRPVSPDRAAAVRRPLLVRGPLPRRPAGRAARRSTRASSATSRPTRARRSTSSPRAAR